MINYTGKLSQAKLKGGMGYGRLLSLSREAAEERLTAFENMGATPVGVDFLTGGVKFSIAGVAKPSAGGGVFTKNTIADLVDENTVCRGATSSGQNNVITKETFISPNYSLPNNFPLQTLTNGVVRELLGFDVPTIKGGQPYTKQTINLYMSSIGLSNFFQIAPCPQNTTTYTTFTATTGDTVSYEGGAFSEAGAIADIAAFSGGIADMLDGKLTAASTTQSGNFTAALYYEYDIHAHNAGGGDWYSHISTNPKQPFVAANQFRDVFDNIVSGVTKIVGDGEILIKDAPSVPVEINHTLSTFDINDTLSAYDAFAFIGQVSGIESGRPTNHQVYVASDYSNCFPSIATIT